LEKKEAELQLLTAHTLDESLLLLIVIVVVLRGTRAAHHDSLLDPQGVRAAAERVQGVMNTTLSLLGGSLCSHLNCIKEPELLGGTPSTPGGALPQQEEQQATGWLSCLISSSQHRRGLAGPSPHTRSRHKKRTLRQALCPPKHSLSILDKF